MRVGVFLTATTLLVATLATDGRATGPTLGGRGPSPRFEVDPTPAGAVRERGPYLVTAADLREPMRHLPPELRWAEGWLERGAAGETLERPDGGGADISELEAFQTNYSDPQNGNVVLILWTEFFFNPPGSISLFIDDVMVGTLDGVPQANIPATNFVFAANLAAGTHTFVVEAQDGTFGEVSIDVLDEVPFTDVVNFECTTGRAVNEGQCEIILDWDDLAPIPTRYVILVNGATLADIPSSFSGAVFAGPAGNYTFEIIGFLETEAGVYRGQVLQTTCDIQCADSPCDGPVNLQLHQESYGDTGQLTAIWLNGESTYASVAGFVNGQPVGNLPGDATTAVFGNLPVGEVTLGVQGNCDADGVSPFAEADFQILAASPHVSPTIGAIECSHDAAAGSTTATWVNGDPSIFIDVFVDIGGDPSARAYVNRFVPSISTITVNGTSADDVVVLQFFTVVDGLCYGSEPIACSDEPPGNSFIRGLCDGAALDPANPTPQVASALFTFNYLFLNGSTPPCLEACDVDDNDLLDLSDGLAVLNYLFLNGPPPTGWVDRGDDGVVDPTCSSAPEADCAASHSFCPQ